MMYYVCIYKVRYEWDERRNRRNQRKHGAISFELAALVFEDTRCPVGLYRIGETRLTLSPGPLSCCWL